MTPAYSVSMLCPLSFRTRYRLLRNYKCAQTLRLYPSTSLLLPMTCFPLLFATTIGTPLLRSCHHSTSFFEPFTHIPHYHFRFKTHKFAGGFAQPTLSLVLRRKVQWPNQYHLGLSTCDRVLVGFSTQNSKLAMRLGTAAVMAYRVAFMDNPDEASGFLRGSALRSVAFRCWAFNGWGKEKTGPPKQRTNWFANDIGERAAKLGAIRYRC